MPTVAMNYRGCNDEKWAARDRIYKCAIVRTSDMTTGKGKRKQWEKFYKELCKTQKNTLES